MKHWQPKLFIRIIPISLLFSLVLVQPFYLLADPAADLFAPGWEKKLPPHPRLIMTPERLAQTKAAVQQSPQKELYQALYAEGEKMLKSPTIQATISTANGRHIIPGRAVEQRIILLALLAQVSGESRFADAAIAQMKDAAGWPDWNQTGEYLDTGDLCAGMALGYDWLYDQMTPDDRKVVSDGICQKALDYVVKNGPYKRSGGKEKVNNWDPVCNGGVALGGLAIAEDQPEVCAKVLPMLIGEIPEVQTEYMADGSYLEGPEYWCYGTGYLVMLMDALDTTFGTTCGLENISGVLLGPRYLEQVTDPGGGFFMYSDAQPYHDPRSCVLWLADRTQDGTVWKAEWERFRQAALFHIANPDAPNNSTAGEKPNILDRFTPLALLWGIPHEDHPLKDQPLPLNWVGNGYTPIAAFRTAWGDPNAAYLAIKGGSALVSHGHMDSGSFTYVWGGIRWVIDAGQQEHIASHPKHWEVFRYGAESHNIIMINDAPQVVKGCGTLLKSQVQPYPMALFDLTSLFDGKSVSQVTREAALLADGRAVLRDHWEIPKDAQSAEVACQFITRAAVQVTAQGVVLSQDKQQLFVLFHGALTPTIKKEAANDLLHSYDDKLPGVTRVRFIYTAAPGQPQDAEMWFCPPGTENKAEILTSK